MEGVLALPSRENELQKNITKTPLMPPLPTSPREPTVKKNNIDVPNNRTALFIGRKGASQKGLEQKPIHTVLQMKGGKTPEEARKTTGWFQNPYDGLWRFEIDDSRATFKIPWEDLVSGRGEYDLSELFEHPELFNAYPELKNIQVKKMPFFGFGVMGSFNPISQTVQISPHLDAEKAKKTLIHELQHWIQYKEGFARGGNERTSRLIDVIPNLKNLYDRLLLETSKRGDEGSFNLVLKDMSSLNKLEHKKPEIEKAMTDIEILKKRRIEFDAETDKILKRLENLMAHKFRQWESINSRYAKLRDDHLKTLDTNTMERFHLWEKKRDAINLQQTIEVKALMDEVEKLSQEKKIAWKRKNPFPKMIKPLQTKLRQTMKPFESLKYTAYKLLAGEQEARISDQRSRMALPERIEKPPYANAIKPGEAILKYNK